MFFNYLKIAWRSIIRQPGYSFIHIVGLTIGLAVCLIVGLFIQHELSYDRFHPEVDHLHRLVLDNTLNGVQWATVQPGLAHMLQSEVPGIEQTTVLSPERKIPITYNNTGFYLDQVLVVDTTFAELFHFKVKSGDIDSAILSPGQVILTESHSTRLFGEKNPIGAVVYLWGENPYTIAAVVEDTPSNSHFRFDALRTLTQSERQIRYQNSPDWMRYRKHVYMRLAENADLTAVQHNINQVIRSNRSQLIGGYLLQPVGRIHLFSHVQQELNPQGNFRVVLLFAGIGLLVLLMAIINYTNLALAKSIKRMQEIGIRKAIGAQTNQIRVQFLAESLLYALVSLPFALVLVQVTIPVINNLFGLSLPGGFQVGILIMGLIILLVTGCIAGLYPAIFLSKQNPEHGLKQGAWRGSNRSHFRKVLLGIQFLLSGMLLFTTITLMQQMKFLQTEEVGFQAENLVSFRRGALPVDSYPAFRHELLSHTAVMNATVGPVPGLGFISNEYAFSTTKKGYEQLHSQYVGKEYVETLGLSLISGQSFTSPEVQQTANPVILNEAAAVLYDITPEKVGQSMSHILFGNITVVGIVANYHNASLYNQIQPVLLKWEPDRVSDILVRLDHRNVKSGLEHIRSVWASYVSDVPLQFSFVDERIQRQYQAERQLAHLFNWFGGLAILLALIGLFGLAGYSVERRTKEFGIRRVLGATGSHLLMLISGEFSSIILVALLIALPLAAVLMNLWLDNFAYHVILGPEIFLITILGLLFCTGIALVGPVIRSMLANPVDTLRYE